MIVAGALARFGGAVAGVFGKTFELFGHFYSSVLKPFVTWSWQQIVNVHAWLKDTFGPLLKFLERVRRQLLDFYAKWFRPIFDTIDVMRSMLRVLETFHVDFARRIDEKLAALEDRLLVPLRLALTKINEAINWIDRIVTFDGLFQRLTLIESAWHYTGDLWSALLKHRPAGVSVEENDTLRKRTIAPVDAKVLSGEVTDYYDTGGGPLAPAIAENVAIWRTLSTE